MKKITRFGQFGENMQTWQLGLISESDVWMASSSFVITDWLESSRCPYCVVFSISELFVRFFAFAWKLSLIFNVLSHTNATGQTQ
jgi:hypothetical protein